MESPFSEKERFEIRDVTEWVYNGAKFSDDSEDRILPDGTDPEELLIKWQHWVKDCLMLLDGDGTFRHWKFPGSYSEQPAFDIQVYRIIKSKYVELVNEKIERETSRMGK